MSKTHIGTVALAVMSKNEMTTIGYGDLHALGEIYREAGVNWRYGPNPTFRISNPHSKLHPLDVNKRILDYLERDERFEKFLFQACNSAGREVLLRAFRIKERTP